MSGADILNLKRDFFGADEAITNYTSGRENWVATLIISETDRYAAWEKRNNVIADIKKKFKILSTTFIVDSSSFSFCHLS